MDKEIIWNIVNSILAGGLVMLGACSTGNMTWESVQIAFVTGVIVAVSQFKDYWKTEQEEYSKKLFMFVG